VVSLPDAVGLCPVHGDEFYMPLWKNETCAPSDLKCPEPRCEERLVVYERTQDPPCPECGQPMTYSEELDAHVCTRHAEE
jgi:hypothetical protein